LLGYSQGEDAVVILFEHFGAQLIELALPLQKQSDIIQALEAKLSKNSKNSSNEIHKKYDKDGMDAAGILEGYQRSFFWQSFYSRTSRLKTHVFNFGKAE
jgi:hypothetical protein